MAKGNGIESKGKTKGKNLGNDGAKLGVEKGGKGSAGVTSLAMKQMGRGMARACRVGHPDGATNLVLAWPWRCTAPFQLSDLAAAAHGVLWAIATGLSWALRRRQVNRPGRELHRPRGRGFAGDRE